MKSNGILAEHEEDSVKHKRFKNKFKRNRSKRIGKARFSSIHNRKMVSKSDPNSELQSRDTWEKNSYESIKKNNSKRAISLQGDTVFDQWPIKGITKKMQHQKVITFHSFVITLTVVIPVSIAVFFIFRTFYKRRKNKKIKKVERKKLKYKLLKDSDENPNKYCPSISSGKADAASAVDFINMLESTSNFTRFSMLANHDKQRIFSDSDKLVKETMKGKCTGISLNLPPINILHYNGFFLSNTDVAISPVLTEALNKCMSSDEKLCSVLKPYANLITADRKERVDSFSEIEIGSLMSNVSSISNSEILSGEICLKIKDTPLVRKDPPELDLKIKSSMKKTNKSKELLNIQEEETYFLYEDEIQAVDSRMSFTTACTTFEGSKRSVNSEKKDSGNRCLQHVNEDEDYISKQESFTNEVIWTPKIPPKSEMKDELKYKREQDQTPSECKHDGKLVSDELRQTSPVQIEITCLAQNNVSNSKTPESSKSKSSSSCNRKGVSPCNLEHPSSKGLPISVCTQTSSVNLRTVGPPCKNCHSKNSNSQKMYRVECVRFLNNNNSNVQKGKKRFKRTSKQYLVTSSKFGNKDNSSTKKSLDLVRKTVNAITEGEKSVSEKRIRKHKTKDDSQRDHEFDSSITKLKLLSDKVDTSSRKAPTKRNYKPLCNNLYKSTWAQSVLEKEPVHTITYLSNKKESSSSPHKFECRKTPYNTEYSVLPSTCYPPLLIKFPDEQTDLEKNWRTSSNSTNSYFKCGKTPPNTEFESTLNLISQCREISKFTCEKRPDNTEMESDQPNSSLSSLTPKLNCRKSSDTEELMKKYSRRNKSFIGASKSFAERQRKQFTRKRSKVTIDSNLRKGGKGHSNSDTESYTRSELWNSYDYNLKEPTHFVRGTNITSSCSLTSLPCHVSATGGLKEFINNDVIYDLRVPHKQNNPLITKSKTLSRNYKDHISNIDLKRPSAKTTPSMLLNQVLLKLESNATGPQNSGYVTINPPLKPNHVRFCGHKVPNKSSDSSTIYASKSSSDLTLRSLDFQYNYKDDLSRCFSSYESHAPVMPEIKVYKKIQR